MQGSWKEFLLQDLSDHKGPFGSQDINSFWSLALGPPSQEGDSKQGLAQSQSPLPYFSSAPRMGNNIILPSSYSIYIKVFTFLGPLLAFTSTWPLAREDTQLSKWKFPSSDWSHLFSEWTVCHAMLRQLMCPIADVHLVTLLCLRCYNFSPSKMDQLYSTGIGGCKFSLAPFA